MLTMATYDISLLPPDCRKIFPNECAEFAILHERVWALDDLLSQQNLAASERFEYETELSKIKERESEISDLFANMNSSA